MITSLDVKNFTAFRDLKIDFSPKINIIIGGNGTGKSHLLKLAYALSSGNKLLTEQSEFESKDLEDFLTKRLLRLFLPLDDKLGKLNKTGQREWSEIKADFSLGKMPRIKFSNNSNSVSIVEQDFDDGQNYEIYKQIPTFIPTKEPLSFMDGFVGLYDRYKLSFDETYKDICLSLDLAEVRGEKLHQKSKWAIEEIAKICGGNFIFYGSGKVTFKVGKVEYSANAIAEGFRKLGILSRLLQTGAIEPGISGTLFWDEPEGNMNPQLMKLLVKILLELSRNGQQIILATHDYVLLKWFDLLMDKNKGDEVFFHSLYYNLEPKNLIVNSTADYLNIKPNPIDEAFEQIINSELDKTMGSLGR